MRRLFTNRLLTYSVETLTPSQMPTIFTGRTSRIVSVFACLRIEPERFIFEEAKQLSTLYDGSRCFIRRRLHPVKSSI